MEKQQYFARFRGSSFVARVFVTLFFACKILHRWLSQQPSKYVAEWPEQSSRTLPAEPPPLWKQAPVLDLR